MTSPATKILTSSPTRRVRIGKDILELITGAMYVNPLDVYREYIQNCADAIDGRQGHHAEAGEIEISLDLNARRVLIKDTGVGVSNRLFDDVMTSIGDSPKRGTDARGFRGIGRLSGLGYCRRLIFRSKSISDKRTKQIIWDGRLFRNVIRDVKYKGSLDQLVRDVTEIGFIDREEDGSFFEVELNGIVRLRNDELLNLDTIRDYLAQVAPVAFDDNFSYSDDIRRKLSEVGLQSRFQLSIEENGINDESRASIVRPYLDDFNASAGTRDRISGVRFFEVAGLNGELDALGWIAEHGYLGAIPKSALIDGLRLRAKNIQVGNANILAEHFLESRFNSWTIGEVHILNSQIIPNGRRDDFEENAHYQNFLAHISPILKDISKTCRRKSSMRQWTRRFEVSEEGIKQDLRRLASGVVATREARGLASAIDERILELDSRINCSRYDFAQELKPRVRRLKSRLNRFLSRENASTDDPLEAVPYHKKSAIKEVLGLIYQYSANRVVANQLIERITKSLATRYSS